jgi:putative oxidoreductase
LGDLPGVGDWVPFDRGYSCVAFFQVLPGAGPALECCCCFFIIDGVEKCRAGQPIESLIVVLFAIVDGALLVTGLWTPIAGLLVIVLSTWGILVQHEDPHPGILLAAIGAALALIGPGALSLDARLFGWKRIDLEK